MKDTLFLKQGLSFLPRGIHASNTGARQPTSYQNHQHLPMINNDVTVDNYNIIPPVENFTNTARNASVEDQLISNPNQCLREPLSTNNSQNTSSIAQHANLSSSASNDFFPRQLIAVSDEPPPATNYIHSLDNDGSSTSDQAMELLRPTTLSSQRY